MSAAGATADMQAGIGVVAAVKKANFEFPSSRRFCDFDHWLA
jgi:hypothetical protein